MSRWIDRARRSYIKRTAPFLKVPGMMGFDERMNLFQLCKAYASPGHLIEFGTLLGASTSAMMAGLAQRGAPAGGARFHVVDFFRTPADSAFAAEVVRLAGSRPSRHPPVQAGEWLVFKEAFLENVAPWQAQVPLTVHECLLADFHWSGDDIGFIHLDLPKDWDQLERVISKTFTSLVPGALLLFQDFVYHWSAELIAFAGHALNTGLLRATHLVDTTLVCTTTRRITADDLVEFRQFMADPKAVLQANEAAAQAVSTLLNRHQAQVLELARLQYLYARLNPEPALAGMGAWLSHNSGQADLCARAGEMLSCGFSAVRSFEKTEKPATSTGN
jgi:hypothetical protein